MDFNLVAVKMAFGITLVVMSLLFSQAKALNCITCGPASGSCSGASVTCPTILGSCASITTAAFVGDTLATELNFKTCFPTAQCLNGSINLGSARVTVSTLCCETDNCNTGRPTAVGGNDMANGRECFSCGLTSCSSRLQCVGGEDRCFSASVEVSGERRTVKGCASSDICTGSFSTQLQSVAVDVSCCEGNLCNSAWSTTGRSVLLLLWPLVSVLLFH